MRWLGGIAVVVCVMSCGGAPPPVEDERAPALPPAPSVTERADQSVRERTSPIAVPTVAASSSAVLESWRTRPSAMPAPAQTLPGTLMPTPFEGKAEPMQARGRTVHSIEEHPYAFAGRLVEGTG